MLADDHPDRIQITFDDRRLVANAGLLLPVTLAQHLGLRELVVSIFMVIRPAIFTDIQPPWERGELTIIRLWLAGQSPPLRPAERGVARAVPGSWRPR